MKIRVQHEGGRIETLTLDGQWLVQEGTKLNRIVGSSSREHFFTKDGYYDGWGCVPQSSDTAEMEIRQIEGSRQIEPSPSCSVEAPSKSDSKSTIQ